MANQIKTKFPKEKATKKIKRNRIKLSGGSKKQTLLSSFFKDDKKIEKQCIKNEAIDKQVHSSKEDNVQVVKQCFSTQYKIEETAFVDEDESYNIIRSGVDLSEEDMYNKVSDEENISSDGTGDYSDHTVDKVLKVSKESKNEDEFDANNKNITYSITKEAILDDTNMQQKSEYELKRLENIARNEARLASLGLLSPSITLNRSTQQQRPRKQKRKESRNQVINYPTRSSSRLRKNCVSSDTVEDNIIDNVQEIMGAIEEPEPAFEVSPIVQYSLTSSNTSSNHQSYWPEYKTQKHPTSLYKVGPTLEPPKGLKSIYSLEFSSTFLVGAGQAGIISLWNLHPSDSDNPPVLSWKGHSGRWISSAKFISPNDEKIPKLVTAGNDGKLCLWDLSVTNQNVPKLLHKSNNELHTNGIFSMDVYDEYIVTGSKDKSVAYSNLCSSTPLWRYECCDKVNSVAVKCNLVLSSSNIVSMHDIRSKEVLQEIDHAHVRPHSVVWNPVFDDIFMTAGYDDIIKTWDVRNTSKPTCVYTGHACKLSKYKKIHHPVFYNPYSALHIITGGEGSNAISMYLNDDDKEKETVYSRGLLFGGDSMALAVDGDRIAVSLEGGDVLLLAPGSD